MANARTAQHDHLTRLQASRRQHLARLGGLFAAAAAGGTALIACGGGSNSAAADGTVSPAATPSSSPAVAPSPAPTGTPKATVLTSSLSHPWGLAYLPDGRLLVSQIGGTMVLVSADGTNVSGPIGGLPAVYNYDQGGLLDVALDPDFNLSTAPWIYWVYAAGDGSGSTTVVARGQLTLTGSGVMTGISPGTVTKVQELYRQSPTVANGKQYGARLVFSSDKTLFIALGDRHLDDPGSPTMNFAQNPALSVGKVLRIHRDGTIPSDNPVVTNGTPGLWSIGHRNPQGAAIAPTTGDLWVSEHGPQGGDELNHVVPGGNYGWPLRSYGCVYGSTPGPACQVGGGTHAPSYIEPVSYWVPKSIAPSGLMFYTGDKFPDWKHNAFIGSLSDNPGGQSLWRIVLNGDQEVSRAQVALAALKGVRVRDVRQSPEGWIDVLTDNGQLIRIDR